MDIKERLNQFIKYKGLKIKTFEEVCGIAKGYAGNARKTMNSDIIDTIVMKFPDLNADWLITGRGSMIYHEGGNFACAIGDGSTNNAVAEMNGGDGYTAGSIYIASLKREVEDLRYTIELQKRIIEGICPNADKKAISTM